jgi:hypothetical protein
MNKILILILMIVAISCNSNSLNHDLHDSPDLHDLDKDTESDDLSDDLSDEVLTEPDEVPEVDEEADLDCPSLKDAPFPYYREDGSIHFCRECDLPAPSDDPDCVRNIWKEKNEQYAHDYPERECAGYPCIIEGLKPPEGNEAGSMIGVGSCDKDIVPLYFNAGSFRGLAFGIDDGKIGTYMYDNKVDYFKYPTVTRAVEYDIEAEKYKVVFPSTSYTISYNKGSFIGTVYDSRKTFNDSDPKPKEYFIYYSHEKGYKVISDKIVDVLPSSLLRLSDEYAAVVIKDDGGVYELRYAKVGEWKWQKIEGVVGYQNYIMVEKNILAFYTKDFNGYFCDMSKSPKSLSECIKLKEYEGYIDDEDVAIDRENPKRIAFSPANVPRKIVVADMTKDEIKYEDYEIELTEKENRNVIVTNFSGNYLVYQEVFSYYIEIKNETITDVKTCFYRLDTKKSYCAKRISERHPYYHGRTDFEGKYLVINSLQGGTLILRDMECYCKLEPDSCPFDEYLPEVPVLKKK